MRARTLQPSVHYRSQHPTRAGEQWRNHSRLFVDRHRRGLTALLCGVAVVCGLSAVRPAPPPTTYVWAAAHPLTPGQTLTEADLALVGLQPEAVPIGATTTAAHSNPSHSPLVKRVVATPMQRHEVLTDTRLIGPSLLAGYPAGSVAAPIRLADTSTSALLRAGDVVDVLAAHPDQANGEDGGPPTAQVVAEAARVISVPSPTTNAMSASSGGQVIEGGLVIVGVTPDQAAQLAHSSTSSRISVRIRPG